MTPEPSAYPESMAHRFRQRIFHPWTHAGDAARSDRSAAQPLPLPLPLPKAKSALSFQARIAEFLLIHRLRARHKSVPSADVLQRAERIVFITCQNWFAPPEQRKPRQHRQL
jgi:hypothetical protein